MRRRCARLFLLLKLWERLRMWRRLLLPQRKPKNKLSPWQMPRYSMSPTLWFAGRSVPVWDESKAKTVALFAAAMAPITYLMGMRILEDLF